MVYRYEIKCVLGSKKTNVFSCAVLAGIALLDQVKAMDYEPSFWWVDLIDHKENRHKLVNNPESGDLLRKEWEKI